MSSTTVLGVTPDRPPVELATYGNAFGWSATIWDRLLRLRGWTGDHALFDDAALDGLWRAIERMPAWQQVPLLLTFDTGVLPAGTFGWAAERLDEFEERAPARTGANHVPAVADLLRGEPDVPFIGVWGTSVSENPFDPWSDEGDERGEGIPLAAMYFLGRHRRMVEDALWSGVTP